MESTPPRRSLRPFIILGVVLGAIALGCFAYWWLNKGYVSTDDAQIDGPIYTIAPQIAGRVARVLVTDNQHVTDGQALVVLDDRDARVALTRAEAQAAQADAQGAVAHAQSAEADAQAAEAQANLQQAQQNYDRYRTVNQRAITQQQLDAATASIMGMRAKANAAQAAQQAARAGVVAAQAAVRAAQVAVQTARLQLSYTVITAPGAGHVSLKTIEPGDVVAPGSAMMAVVGDHVWITANYKETELANIKPGAVAHVTVDAIPGIVFKARVDSIQYGTGAVFSLLPAQNATGNYIKIVQRVPVKLVFEDNRIGQYMLAPGMSVEPSIVIAP